MSTRLFWSVFFVLAVPSTALAYGGPGAGITLIGSLVGVIAAVLASLFYVVVYPLRQLRRKRRHQMAHSAPDNPATAEALVRTQP